MPKESSVFPRRASEAAQASLRSATWGLEMELETEAGCERGGCLSLPPSPVCARGEALPLVYAHDYMVPSPEEREAVSFGLDDV